jgi:hypothetical protein
VVCGGTRIRACHCSIDLHRHPAIAVRGTRRHPFESTWLMIWTQDPVFRPAKRIEKFTRSSSTEPSSVPAGTPLIAMLPVNRFPVCVSWSVPPPRGATPKPDQMIDWQDGDAVTDKPQLAVNVRVGVVGAPSPQPTVMHTTTSVAVSTLIWFCLRACNKTSES